MALILIDLQIIIIIIIITSKELSSTTNGSSSLSASVDSSWVEVGGELFAGFLYTKKTTAVCVSFIAV